MRIVPPLNKMIHMKGRRIGVYLLLSVGRRVTRSLHGEAQVEVPELALLLLKKLKGGKDPHPKIDHSLTVKLTHF